MDFSINVTNEDARAASEYLAELGIDPKEESEFGLKQISRLHFMAKAYSNQIRDNKLLERLKAKITEVIENNNQLARDILQSTIAQRKASFQFRNVEKWTDDEMREVLSDLDIARLLEDLDKVE